MLASIIVILMGAFAALGLLFESSFRGVYTTGPMLLLVPAVMAARRWGRTALVAAGAAAVLVVFLNGLPFWETGSHASWFHAAWSLFLVVMLACSADIFDRVHEAGETRRIRAAAYAAELDENRNLLKGDLAAIESILPGVARKADRNARLNDLAIVLNDCADIEALLAQTVAWLDASIAEGAAVVVRVQSGDGIAARSSRGACAHAWDALDRHVMVTGLPLHVRDVDGDFRFAAWNPVDRPPRSVIATPILEGERPIGVLRVESPKPRRFSAEQLRVLTYVSNALSLSHQIQALYGRAVELSRRDGLTGLYKRWWFDETLATEVRRGRRHAAPLSLVMMDIDDFRTFNNTWGHPVGDAVLKAVAAVAKDTAAASFTGARYGGEEIAIILPGADAAAAAALAETIRTRVEAVHTSLDLPSRVTLSLGVAAFDPNAMARPEDLIAAADAALYAAKRNGKNRVVTKS
jgi:diguanylate cyclase (GGDEF)-like protein